MEKCTVNLVQSYETQVNTTKELNEIVSDPEFKRIYLFISLKLKKKFSIRVVWDKKKKKVIGKYNKLKVYVIEVYSQCNL